MSQVWIENLTINERPRSTQICNHCLKACIEAVPRARLSFLSAQTLRPESAHLHIPCVAPFISDILKAHTARYKDELKAKGRKLV